MPEVRLYPDALTPGVPDESDGTPNRILGTVFYSDVDTWVVALEWFTPETLPAFCSLSLWNLASNNPLATTGTRRALLTFTVASMTGGAWNRLDLSEPWELPANTPMYVGVHTDGHYVFSNPGTFPFESEDGTLHAYAALDAGNGRWTNSGDNNSIAGTNLGSGDGYNFFVGVVTNTDVEEIGATLDIVLPPPQAESEAAGAATATIDIVLPAPIADAAGGVEASAAIDLVLPDYEIEAAAAVEGVASLDIVLPTPVAAVAGSAPAAAAFDVVLPAVAVGADAIAPAGAAIAVTLPAIAAAAQGDTDVGAALDIVLPTPVAAAAAGGETGAVLDITLPSVAASAQAARDISATVTIVLPTIANTLGGETMSEDPTGVIAGDGTETVTVIRPPGRDAFGDPLAGASPQHHVQGCMFAPGASAEHNFAANQIDTDGAIYAPPGSDFLATDRVRIRGEIYVVAGKPQVWGTAGIVVPVRRVTG